MRILPSSILCPELRVCIERSTNTTGFGQTVTSSPRSRAVNITKEVSAPGRVHMKRQGWPSWEAGGEQNGVGGGRRDITIALELQEPTQMYYTSFFAPAKIGIQNTQSNCTHFNVLLAPHRVEYLFSMGPPLSSAPDQVRFFQVRLREFSVYLH